MMRKYFFIACFLSVAGALHETRQAQAEFVCLSDISYQWVKQEPQPTLAEDGGRSKARSASGQTPLPVSTAVQNAQDKSDPEPSIVRFATVERRGRDEVEAKSALQIEVNRQKGRASDKCRQDHENFGQCLATKLSVKSSVLNSLSFSARAQLEKALTEECQIQLGTCLNVASTEPACREIVGEQKADAEPAGTSKGGKAGEAAGKEAPAASAKGKQPKKK